MPLPNVADFLNSPSGGWAFATGVTAATLALFIRLWKAERERTDKMRDQAEQTTALMGGLRDSIDFLGELVLRMVNRDGRSGG